MTAGRQNRVTWDPKVVTQRALEISHPFDFFLEILNPVGFDSNLEPIPQQTFDDSLSKDFDRSGALSGPVKVGGAIHSDERRVKSELSKTRDQYEDEVPVFDCEGGKWVSWTFASACHATHRVCPL